MEFVFVHACNHGRCLYITSLFLTDVLTELLVTSCGEMLLLYHQIPLRVYIHISKN